MPTAQQQVFLQELDNFINKVMMMPSFKGKTAACKSLRRISTLSALRK